MRIIHVKSLEPSIKNVVLFTEDKKEDYLYNHQLSITEDKDDEPDELQARKYDKLPDVTNVSDRLCCFKYLKVSED